MKKDKVADDSRIWCAACYIRVAPHDRQASFNGKTYHDGCYAKLRHAQKQQKKA
jgi:hypothetical protein